jgi:ADP-heptose:LPS heptosyltransferase
MARLRAIARSRATARRAAHGRAAPGDDVLRILFITATRLGDGVLSTGLYGHLAERHPGARFTVVCGAPAAPVFAAAPGLERLIVLEKRPFHGHWLGLWTAVAGKVWDLVVDIRGSGFAWTLLARERRIKPRAVDGVHRVADLATLFGLPEPPAPRAWTTAAEEARAADLLPPGGPILAVAPTANWRAKEWRVGHFRALVERLTAAGALAGARVAAMGAPDERARAEPLIAALPADRRIDLYGAPLGVIAACLRRADLFVGNDSGLMHLAAAAGAPTLGLFGPSRAEHYAPWGPRAAFVRTRESWSDLVMAPGFDHRTSDTLMDGLIVEVAAAAAEALLQRCRGSTTIETPDRRARGR